ncbi:hypothetical protein GCM10009718_13130 [Isoptericola halotolerans]|uniref:Uncharacterized protein n=1 Tax=Isoptericola halotolerans TaxID=300560 RepID=A0ABX1ZYT5_9MICO|nr:hypothetical protein [Isoptericola halotolerans]NOV95767.1 hypothetical protein [Isoptericola halotolerans]
MRNPTIDDVRAAVDWALTHDLAALLAYRQVAHLDKGARWQADAALVARWHDATDDQGSARRRVAEHPRAHC